MPRRAGGGGRRSGGGARRGAGGGRRIARRGGGRRGRHRVSRFYSRPRRYHRRYYQSLPWYNFWRPSYWSYYPYYLYYDYYGYPYNYPYYGYWNTENYEVAQLNEQQKQQAEINAENEEEGLIKQIEDNIQSHENFQLLYLLMISAGLVYLLKRN
jgi:hypothetical protein